MTGEKAYSENLMPLYIEERDFLDAGEIRAAMGLIPAPL
jgi:hypothetical protein